MCEQLQQKGKNYLAGVFQLGPDQTSVQRQTPTRIDKSVFHVQQNAKRI